MKFKKVKSLYKKKHNRIHDDRSYQASDQSKHEYENMCDIHNQDGDEHYGNSESLNYENQGSLIYYSDHDYTHNDQGNTRESEATNDDNHSSDDYSVTSTSQDSIDPSRLGSRHKINIPYLKSKYMMEFTAYFMTSMHKSKRYEMNRLCHFLMWTYSESNSQNQLPVAACKSWTYSLFSTHLQSIYCYCYKHLRLMLELEYTTIKLFLSQVLSIYHEWYCYLRSDCSSVYIISNENKFSYNDTIKVIRKMCSKQNKKLCKGIMKTKKFFIENHKLPDGDSISFISNLVEKKYNIFLEISKHSCSINKRNYNRYIQLLCTSFYIGAQGRTRSVEDLIFKDMEVLLNSTTYLESEKFKTSNSLIIQPVSLNWLGRYATYIHKNI